MATPAMTGVAPEPPVSARSLPPEPLPPIEAGLGSPTVWVVMSLAPPWVLQSSTPLNRFAKPLGPLIVKSYAWSSWSGTVIVWAAPAAMVCSTPISSNVNASSPLLTAVMSTPPSSQFFSAVSAGIAPFAAQSTVAVAETVDSLEPARICVWLRESEAKARPTGTLVDACTVSDADPSGLSFGMSKKRRLPSAAEVTGLPCPSTTFTPLAAVSAGGATVTPSASVWTVTGPSRSPG